MLCNNKLNLVTFQFLTHILKMRKPRLTKVKVACLKPFHSTSQGARPQQSLPIPCCLAAAPSNIPGASATLPWPSASQGWWDHVFQRRHLGSALQIDWDYHFGNLKVTSPRHRDCEKSPGLIGILIALSHQAAMLGPAMPLDRTRGTNTNVIAWPFVPLAVSVLSLSLPPISNS